MSSLYIIYIIIANLFTKTRTSGDMAYIPKYPFAQSLIASSRITKHQFTLTGLPKFKTEFSIDILLHCISAQS